VWRRSAAAGLAAVVALLAAGCSSAPKAHSAEQAKLPVGPPGTTTAGVLRLGVVLDAADAPGLVGWQAGFFQRSLGRVTLETQTFTSAALENVALEDGQLDAAYVDPVSAVIVSQASHVSLRIVAGAASGGTELVVRKDITRPGQLRGRHVVAPGGVQQAAADVWMHANGLPGLTAAEAAPSADAGVLREFRSGAIAGGWEMAPLDAEMTAAGGRVLVNETSQWPGGRFPTAVLAVTGTYLSAHPAAVTDLVAAQLEAAGFVVRAQVSAEAMYQQRMAVANGRALPKAVLTGSFDQVRFTYDPLETDAVTEIREATTAGILRPVADPAALFDLGMLNAQLLAAHRKPVSS
jgi:NitT/TauT family transport system substrate-binding protein